MIWTSLRVGWGNTSAIFALALLPIILIGSPAPKPPGQDRAHIERQYPMGADQRRADLTLSAD